MCVSYWVPCLTGVSQGCDISNCYCFPIANWRKEISFIYDYIAKRRVIFQLAQLVHFSFVTTIHWEPEAYSELWRPPEGNQTYKRLQSTCCDLLTEVWKRRHPEKDYQRIPSTWNMTHDTKEIHLEHILAHKTMRKCKLHRAKSYILKQSLGPVFFLSTLSVYLI